MSGFRVILAEMDSLAEKLDAGTGGLDRMDPSPPANAGESIALVAKAIEQLGRASAGVSGGSHSSAEDVREAKATYLRADQTTIDDLVARPWGTDERC